MAELVNTPDVPLTFYLGDIPINQGYHVTEVKYATIKSMDCGKQVDAWDELLIQLLDGPADSGQGFMSTSKFTNIVSSALDSLPANENPDLFFEFSPNNGPLQKLRIQTIECEVDNVSVLLADERAACKPFLRGGMSITAVTGKVTEMAKTGCCTSASLGREASDETKTGCCSSVTTCCG